MAWRPLAGTSSTVGPMASWCPLPLLPTTIFTRGPASGSGRDNVYNFSVRASDGRYYGYLEITVTEEAVNEPPAVTGTTTFTYKENGAATLYTFRATDPEGSAINWSLSGADDDFTISETGVLSFASSPDYEGPADSDRDNVYEITVVARDDDFNSGMLQITITVINLTD